MNKMNVSSNFIALMGKIVVFLNKTLLSKFKVVLCPIMFYKENRDNYIYKYHDYIRISSLELVANEIYENKISGNVAELGVFQGRFAKYINQAFHDRKLYLFDTFEGFNEKDIKKEENVNGRKGVIHDFSKTNVESVLKKMRYKENCIIKKGYFPETVKDLEDSFVFVSIDVDLYEPIYNGLAYFYPRLKKGGYIFIHDFNDAKIYKGAKIAVKKYCMEHSISYFPLTDGGGSVIIVK